MIATTAIRLKSLSENSNSMVGAEVTRLNLTTDFTDFTDIKNGDILVSIPVLSVLSA